MTLLSLVAILLLPRQFHVAVVENNDEREIRRAAWLFPLYLLLINLFVMPIAIAGLLTFPPAQVDSDMFVLALPLSAGSSCTIAGLRRRPVGGDRDGDRRDGGAGDHGLQRHRRALVLQRREALLTGRKDVGSLLLDVRPHRDLRHPAAGLHVLPLRRRRATCLDRPVVVRRHRAARAGVLRRPDLAARDRPRRHGRHDRRHLVWAYTLLLPTLADAGSSARAAHRRTLGARLAAAAGAVRAELPPLVHGVSWSLGLNMLAYIGFSLRRAPSAIERMQAICSCRQELAPITPSSGCGARR